MDLIMIWKASLLLSLVSCVYSDRRPAVPERNVKLPFTSHRGDLPQIGRHGPEHHGAYAWAYPSYEFSYKVDDPRTHDEKSQHEVRNGGDVIGNYWLIQPDGERRHMRYHVDDENGFTAVINYTSPHSSVYYNVMKHHEEAGKHKGEKQEPIKVEKQGAYQNRNDEGIRNIQRGRNGDTRDIGHGYTGNRDEKGTRYEGHRSNGLRYGDRDGKPHDRRYGRPDSQRDEGRDGHISRKVNLRLDAQRDSKNDGVHDGRHYNNARDRGHATDPDKLEFGRQGNFQGNKHERDDRRDSENIHGKHGRQPENIKESGRGVSLGSRNEWEGRQKDIRHGGRPEDHGSERDGERNDNKNVQNLYARLHDWNAIHKRPVIKPVWEWNEMHHGHSWHGVHPWNEDWYISRGVGETLGRHHQGAEEKRENSGRNEEEQRHWDDEKRGGNDKNGGERRHLDTEKRKSDEQKGGEQRRWGEERRGNDERERGEQRRRGEERRGNDERERGEQRHWGEEMRESDERERGEQRRWGEERRRSNDRKEGEQRHWGEERRGSNNRKEDEQRRCGEEMRGNDERERGEQRRRGEERRGNDERERGEQRHRGEEKRGHDDRQSGEQRRRGEEKRGHDERERGEQHPSGEEKRGSHETEKKRGMKNQSGKGNRHQYGQPAYFVNYTPMPYMEHY